MEAGHAGTESHRLVEGAHGARRPRVARRAALAVAAATLALIGVPASAAAVPATDGRYHGVMNGSATSPCGGNEGEGWFRYRSDIGKIVAPGTTSFCGFSVSIPNIYAPTDPLFPAANCHQGNPKLPDNTRIPVDASGAFSWRGVVPIGPGGTNRTVIFRGRWKTDTRVVGTTRVKDGTNCVSDPIRWRMNRLP
jgi:hypothetical protein